MIIQHNIMAINSHRQLGINNTNLSKNLEKLSSGYRINRAADDAAGLAISEKMRAQITGLNRAVMNAQDGASLIQTAEGALQEVHGMLNRMVELATQSANGTIQASDRQKIEAETQALKDEIDRISKATNFNGIALLDGSLSTTTPKSITTEGVRTGEDAAIAGQYAFSAFTTVNDAVAGDKYEFTVSLQNGDSFTETFTISKDGKTMVSSDGTVHALSTAANSASAATVTDVDFGKAMEAQLRKTKLQDDFIIKTHTGNTGITLTSRETGTAAPAVKGIELRKNGGVAETLAQNAAGTTDATSVVAKDAERYISMGDLIPFAVTNNVSNEELATFEVNGEKFVLVNANALGDDTYANAVAQLENDGVNIISIAGANVAATDLSHIAADINNKTGLALKADVANTRILLEAKSEGNGLTMQVGDTAAAFNKITVSVDDMSSAGLGIKNISMATQESASRALDRINAAIEKVSVNRGNLGALQNRLEYTINNLNVTSENITAAESRIRDVDMAKEMMAFTKNNVLSQAAQAMLAQANQQPQNVLQLLR
ncbi:MAG: flagellin [Ruminococcaceae bacterium]|nr:flagellin [Oscillospiraceae bacterium]